MHGSRGLWCPNKPSLLGGTHGYVSHLEASLALPISSRECESEEQVKERGKSLTERRKWSGAKLSCINGIAPCCMFLFNFPGFKWRRLKRSSVTRLFLCCYCFHCTVLWRWRSTLGIIHMPPQEALRVWRMRPLRLNYAVHKLMNSTPFSSTNKTLDAHIIKSSLT